MYGKCCVPKCNSLRKDIKLHQFPTSEQLKTQWLKSIALEDVREVKNMFVCHKHFERRFVNPGTKRLKLGSYPTLFTHLEISSGKPTSATKQTDKTVPCSDHSYMKKRHIDHTYVQGYELEQSPTTFQRLEASKLSSAEKAVDIEIQKILEEIGETEKQGASVIILMQRTPGKAKKLAALQAQR